MSVTLRPYQQAVVDRFVALPKPQRLFLAWDMGAGKTIAALAMAEAIGAKRILIVCPAIVRSIWQHEIERLWPDADVGLIIYSPTRKVCKRSEARRTQSYAAPIKIVSYDLLGRLPAQHYDLIIVDEFHALRSVISAQSLQMRAVFQYSPHAAAIGLSGTPIPNEAKQLWNPVDTFFPLRWGMQTRKGYEPFAFCARYCHKRTNEYGTRYTGLREERREELQAKFAEISDRVTQEQFAHLLPPLHVQSLDTVNVQKPTLTARKWWESLPADTAAIGIYTHLQQTAHDIADMVAKTLPIGTGLFCITGETTPEARERMLNSARAMKRSIVVATTHSLQEGISLSFQKAALLVQWTSDVAGVVQFLGRFARQDATSMAPTRVDIAIGPNDLGAAQTISERVEAMNSVIRASQATSRTQQAFAPTEMSDDAFYSQLQTMAVSHHKRSQLWTAEADDDGDED